MQSSPNQPWYGSAVTAETSNHNAERSFPELPKPPRGEWWSDESVMETYRHLMQQLALIATLRWLWRDRTDYFVGGNLTVYYSPNQRRSEDFRGPDVFVALGVDGTRDRKSWVVWEEDGKYPNVIIELLSDSTAATDRGEKKLIYEQTFRTPEYFWFDPYSFELAGFRLIGGHYQPIPPDEQGRVGSEQLDLLLGVVDGSLRLFTRDGALVPTPEESAEHAADRADAAERRADDEHRRADDEHRRAEEERRRADRAEAELAKLRAHARDRDPDRT